VKEKRGGVGGQKLTRKEKGNMIWGTRGVARIVWEMKKNQFFGARSKKKK
jgi:hypothetical protein